ncbi:di-heme oxidoredictase family protein [uncultured Tateyamaria sp.]|uniref:di-heme oxidoredictase family protein n=1 Tax=uncultured Tateyamaria sp. TaxID=455651 RepID=UPI00260186A4|nr:di-heme oxidoredictase family protein [uncultured Tateyamaria sp.]
MSGGETATLRRPYYTLTNLGYGDLHPEMMLSPRVAPQMIGLGLLDAIPAADILAGVDPDDADGDGIAGRAPIVMSSEYSVPKLGRFGLKAGQPSIWEQSASAFAGDVGISTTLPPAGFGDCAQAQTKCRTAPNDNTPDKDNVEIGDMGPELVSLYSANLGVPARRDVSAPQLLRGKQVFYETGWIACHTPKHATHRLDGRPIGVP